MQQEIDADQCMQKKCLILKNSRQWTRLMWSNDPSHIKTLKESRLSEPTTWSKLAYGRGRVSQNMSYELSFDPSVEAVISTTKQSMPRPLGENHLRAIK